MNKIQLLSYILTEWSILFLAYPLPLWLICYLSWGIREHINLSISIFIIFWRNNLREYFSFILLIYFFLFFILLSIFLLFSLKCYLLFLYLFYDNFLFLLLFLWAFVRIVYMFTPADITKVIVTSFAMNMVTSSIFFIYNSALFTHSPT